jgi:hypothetical protein
MGDSEHWSPPPTDPNAPTYIWDDETQSWIPVGGSGTGPTAAPPPGADDDARAAILLIGVAEHDPGWSA